MKCENTRKNESFIQERFLLINAALKAEPHHSVHNLIGYIILCAPKLFTLQLLLKLLNVSRHCCRTKNHFE